MKIGIFSILLLTLVSATGVRASLAPAPIAPGDAPVSVPALLSAEDARSFCLEQWFPRLVLGEGELAPALDRLLELYTEDFELVDPNNVDLFGVPVARGKALARRYYQSVLRNYPRWSFEILAIYPTETGFVLRYEGKNAGPVASFEGTDIIELRKEGGAWKIARLMGYYDRKPFTPAP